MNDPLLLLLKEIVPRATIMIWCFAVICRTFNTFFCTTILSNLLWVFFPSVWLTMVFCLENCSDLPWEKKCWSDWEKLLKFRTEGREFGNFLRSLEQFIETAKGQNIFWIKKCFLTCSRKFLKWIGTIRIKIGNNIWI